jgi:hypothetical protein
LAGLLGEVGPLGLSLADFFVEPGETVIEPV